MKKWRKPELTRVNRSLLLFDMLALMLAYCSSINGKLDEIAAFIGLVNPFG